MLTESYEIAHRERFGRQAQAPLAPSLAYLSKSPVQLPAGIVEYHREFGKYHVLSHQVLKFIPCDFECLFAQDWVLQDRLGGRKAIFGDFDEELLFGWDFGPWYIH
jgi:hypothetical protein